MKQLLPNGKPVPHGAMVMVDHCLTQVSITFRSTATIDEDVLKRLLQQRFEVTGLQVDEIISICKPMGRAG